jgi:hypothetical protein
MKCKAHSQGDRCRKEAGHEEVDPVHEGQFAIWQENKFREEKCALSGPRRNRRLDRTLRSFDPGRVNPAMRKQAIAFMSGIIAQAPRSA